MMKDSETFNSFPTKLNYIVNSSFNLGETISKSKIVMKILRSLPERFCPKVVAVEEYQNPDSLTIEKLVGDLQTLETNHCSTKMGNNIALMSSKFVESGSNVESDCESANAEFEEFFVKKFKNLWKNKKNNFKKDFLNNMALNKSKFDKKPVKRSYRPILSNAMNVKDMVALLLSVPIEKRKAKVRL